MRCFFSANFWRDDGTITYMLKPIVGLFILLALVFAAVHTVAVKMSLYWYFSWFDVVMHLFGGLLIALGMVSLTSFRSVSLKPSLKLLLAFLFPIIISWEVFEWFAGLSHPATAVYDVSKDLLVGFVGAIGGYWLIQKNNS